MKCLDENIITLILEPGSRAEIQAVRCLVKCERQTAGVLFKMSLRDKEERHSIFHLAVAEFIMQVRQGKFVFTGVAKICTYLTEIARRKWLEASKKNKPLPPDMPDPVTGSGDELEENLYEALQQLDDADRDILVAFYFYDSSLDDYAKKNNMSHDAAKKRISRARERLKNVLKQIAP